MTARPPTSLDLLALPPLDVAGAIALGHALMAESKQHKKLPERVGEALGALIAAHDDLESATSSDAHAQREALDTFLRSLREYMGEVQRSASKLPDTAPRAEALLAPILKLARDDTRQSGAPQ